MNKEDFGMATPFSCKGEVFSSGGPGIFCSAAQKRFHKRLLRNTKEV